ncbi:DUF4124 domain-containing protein [Aquabacterium sp. J223]|uniref:DUF4124 domain-containing protein n=1 Tax=Aquabacterium sp. J223 TaxID=2898431 RepID=UPI0021ADEA55|nr:DUF4124 domain-containing protein [Aquabacterium sp. J223]UUX93977.1 DUF4124 domain-containing protein [Aquabacterium sp. J223]
MHASATSPMRPLGRAALALALALVTVGAQAQWTWRDRNGQLHASDRPPPAEVPERDIVRRPHQQRAATPAPRPAPAASAADPNVGSGREPAAAPKGDPELEARLKRANEEKQAQAEREKARVAALRADNCQRAQEALRTYESGIRLTRVNERGEREFIDDNARAEQIARAQQVVQADCR